MGGGTRRRFHTRSLQALRDGVPDDIRGTNGQAAGGGLRQRRPQRPGRLAVEEVGRGGRDARGGRWRPDARGCGRRAGRRSLRPRDDVSGAHDIWPS